MDIVNTIDDLEGINYVDPAIQAAYAHVMRLHVDKGLTYYEVARSKFFGDVRYLVRFDPDRIMTILNLNTGEEVMSRVWKLTGEKEER